MPPHGLQLAEPDLVDDQIEGDGVRLGQGRAFSVNNGTENLHRRLPVVKRLQQESRKILYEEVEYEAIRPLLEQLKLSRASSEIRTAALPQNLRAKVNLGRAIPPATFAHVEKTLKAAQLGKSGVKIDYVITLTYSQANYVFRSDCTYLISGAVGLTGSSTVFEGGSVIKYAPLSYAYLSVQTPIVWKGTAYAPVVMTARDDNSIGEVVSGSTGNPWGRITPIPPFNLSATRPPNQPPSNTCVSVSRKREFN